MLNLEDKYNCGNIDGKSVDFYLEDDMFEIEGRFEEVDGEIFILVVDAVSHMLKIAGNRLKVGEKYEFNSQIVLDRTTTRSNSTSR